MAQGRPPEDPAAAPRGDFSTQVDHAPDPGGFLRHLAGISQLPTVQEQKRLTYELLRPRSGARLLDVGCGPGDDVLALAALVGPTGRVVGVDNSTTMLTEARRPRVAGGASTAVGPTRGRFPAVVDSEPTRSPHRAGRCTARRLAARAKSGQTNASFLKGGTPNGAGSGVLEGAGGSRSRASRADSGAACRPPSPDRSRRCRQTSAPRRRPSGIAATRPLGD
jgi:hypothetical protein